MVIVYVKCFEARESNEKESRARRCAELDSSREDERFAYVRAAFRQNDM